MKPKTFYRKITKFIDAAMFQVEQACDMAGSTDPDLLKWADKGEEFFEKYKKLRDEAPSP